MLFDQSDPFCEIGRVLVLDYGYYFPLAGKGEGKKGEGGGGVYCYYILLDLFVTLGTWGVGKF